MAKLIADKTRTELGVKINEKIIPNSAAAGKYVASWCKKGQPMKPCRSMRPTAVCIHNTGDLANVEDDAEQYTRATWPNCNMGGVVVHYYVDELGAWQNLREDEQGWHAGDGAGPGNTKSVAIEIIMNGSTGANNIKAEDNGARLAAAILHRWGLGIDALHSHYYYNRKNCPIYIRPHWAAFESKVKKYLDALSSKPNVDTGAAGGKLYRVQVGAFWERKNAEKMQKELEIAGFPGIIKEVSE